MPCKTAAQVALQMRAGWRNAWIEDPTQWWPGMHACFHAAAAPIESQSPIQNDL